VLKNMLMRLSLSVLFKFYFYFTTYSVSDWSVTDLVVK